jgi:hypothetical protein
MGHGEPVSSPGDADHRRHATVLGVGTNRGDPGMTHGAAFWFHCALAVLRRPHLWFPAIRQFARTIPTRWWTRSPFLPVPDRAYLQFRLETAYGEQATPRVPDVVRYLEWCREAG